MTPAPPLPEKIGPFRIGVISDTHGRLVPQVFELFEGVDLILHAGDVGGDHLLIELEALAPVQAVCGNVDWPESHPLPAARRLENAAGRIGMTHGHLPGAPTSDLARMHASFGDFAPSIVIFGHSHIPLLKAEGGVTWFNPGSAGAPRFGRGPSVGLITVPEAGAAPRFEHLALDR